MKNIVMIQTPEYVQIPFETAGIGTRAVAKLIDFFCIFVVSAPLGLFTAISYEFTRTKAGYHMGSILFAILFFITAALPLAYFVCTEYWMKGQTFGKRVMQIRVIQDNGKNPSFLSIFLRNLLQLADLLPSLYLFGIISIFIHRQEKRLGDMFAGTLVVYENRGKQAELHLQFTSLHLMQAELDIFKRLTQVSGERYLLLESFLIRRTGLHKGLRDDLAKQLIEKCWPEIETLPGYEEAFLEKLYLYLRQTTYPSHYPRLVPNYFPAAS